MKIIYELSGAMDSGGSKTVKKDNILDSTKRKNNQVLKSTVKTILTGQLSSNGQGSSSSGKSSRVAPE